MKTVVDTNRIIAALIKEGTTREILFDKRFSFITPDHTIVEIFEHESELRAKSKLDHYGFNDLVKMILDNVDIVPKSYYEKFIDDCKLDISDIKDIPILATAIAVRAHGIWAHDPHFKEQDKVKVFTNIDMLRFTD